MKETAEAIESRRLAAAERHRTATATRNGRRWERMSDRAVLGMHKKIRERFARMKEKLEAELGAVRRARREAQFEHIRRLVRTDFNARLAEIRGERLAQDARMMELRTELVESARRKHADIVFTLELLGDQIPPDVQAEMRARERDAHAARVRDAMTKNAGMLERFRRIDLLHDVRFVGHALEIGRRSSGSPLTLLSAGDCRTIVLLLVRYSVVSREIEAQSCLDSSRVLGFGEDPAPGRPTYAAYI
jgi:hypothetical protein